MVISKDVEKILGVIPHLFFSLTWKRLCTHNIKKSSHFIVKGWNLFFFFFLNLGARVVAFLSSIHIALEI